MVTMRVLYKIVASICLMFVTAVSTSWPLHAQTTPPSAPPLPAPSAFIGQYYFSWAGIKLGKLELSIDEKADAYALHLGVTSAGIVNLFTHHISDTTVVGKRHDGRYCPIRYESRYQTKKKPRHILLVFDPKRHITEELNEPPENRAIRPEVPAELKDGSYDPLSGLMALRQGISPLTAFDAKRLYQVKAEEKEHSSLTVMEKTQPVIHYILTRTPLGGMTAKETEEYKAGEPPLHLFISDDEKRVPVLVQMPVLMGNVKGTLIKECSTWDECKVQ